MSKLSFSIDDLVSGCNTLKSKSKFSPGFDKMTPESAEIWLKINGEKLCHQLNSGKYSCMPAVGFNIAKAGGSYRKLAKLTAIDTIVQQCILEKISDECENKYSEHSFAYRRGKGVHLAIQKYCEYATNYTYTIKIDQKSCFDSLDYSILEKELYRFFFERKTVNMLMDIAKAKVIEEGILVERTKGILQGSPLSGILCNIYFDSFDKKMEELNIPFIRYADDIVLFAESRDEAEKSFEHACCFLRENLHLKPNTGKSYVDLSEKIVWLGNKFMRTKDGSVISGVSDKSLSIYYDWYSSKPQSHRNSIDILSDGILRQKDYSAIFDTDEAKTDIPLETIERINIFSNVIFDTRFLELAMNSGIYVNVFSRNYQYIGRFAPSTSFKSPDLIFNQLSTYYSDVDRLQLAKEFDLASVHNLRLNIRYHNKQNENDIYIRALKGIENLYHKMKECTSYENLLLIEAQIRALYYSCYDCFIKNDSFVFGKRSKQPPLNEVNSLISFGNVVLYSYIATEIYKSSLDIRIGYLHATNRRSESLNLDIAEIFKPLLVDRVVFSLINRREIKLSHFEKFDNGGIYLNEEGKRIFLRDFYGKLNTTIQIDNQNYSYAVLINKEIQKLIRRFRKDEKYTAFRQVR